MNQMDEAMELENQTAIDSCSSPAADMLPPENYDDSLSHHNPPFGTIIPNRIFVGGIDEKVNEGDLCHVFSQHAAVREVKIVIDRSGMPKGYGFVTFETRDDARKILHDAKGFSVGGKKLSIAQAVRKQQVKSGTVISPDSAMRLPLSFGNLFQTLSTGYPCTYSGAPYFHWPNMNPPRHHWPPAPPVMLPQSPQPVYQQPSYYPYQCVPNQYQWNVLQPSIPSSQVMYPQPSEYLQPPEGVSVQPPHPVTEDAAPEFKEPAPQHTYPVYPQRTEGKRPLQHDPGKNQMFPPSHVQPKTKYTRRHVEHKDLRYLPAATELPDASTPHKSQPLK